MEDIIKIQLKDKELILVGTAHISKKSAEFVDEIIKKEKPDIVAVELCKSRYETLMNEKKWQNTKITKIIREGKTYLFMINLILSILQRKIGAGVKMAPGAEMLAAIKSAEKQKAKIALVDRDIQITLKRAWAKARFMEKIELVSEIIEGLMLKEKVDEKAIEEIKEKDIIANMMEDLGKKMPRAKEVLLDERDVYIANKILALEGKKIVAVIGAGHIEGVKKHLKEKLNIKYLEETPPKSRLIKALNYSIPAIIIGIILSGFIFHKSPDVVFSVFLYWFLLGGCLSALAIIFFSPHPLTILSAFIAFPFTLLSPTLSVGMVAGYVEAKMREPKVKDFENLNQIISIRGIFRNRISRILLIAIFSGIGGSLATFIVLTYLIKTGIG